MLNNDNLANNLTLTVRISDAVGNSVTEDIRVFVVDDESNELLSSVSKEWMIDEDTPIGSSIGSLADLQDNNNRGRRERYIYSLINKRDHVSDHLPFFLNSASGEIFVTGSLNRTRRSAYELEVEIQSTSGVSAPITASILIKIGSDESLVKRRPQFQEDPVTVKVREDANVGQVIHTLRPSSIHKGLESLNYVMLEQMPTSAFTIEDKTGKIKVAKDLDFEKEHNYVLTVRVTEASSQLSTFVTIIVMITDVNDNRPTFITGTEVSLSSDVATGSPFMTVVATDQDPGDNGKILYSIRNGNEDATFRLDSDTGDLFLMKPASRQDYYLQIRAEDRGVPTTQYTDQQLHINFAIGIGSNGPKFVQTMFDLSILENSPPSSMVSILSANNPGRDELSFKLLVGGDNFNVDPRSGELRTLTNLDREEQDKYSLVVSVADQRHPEQSDTAIVNVDVTDTNDNDPAFGASCRDLNVPENAEVDYIHAVVAADLDAGDNGRLTYRIANSPGPFSLDPDSGRISSLPLDRESQPSYRLEIIAQDQGANVRRSANCLITINVSDENDNDPVFSQSLYSASVKEDVPKGTEVLRVVASDDDDGVNAEIKYSIENTTTNAFAIDRDTGSIVTKELLDRETTDKYTFSVVAFDNGKANVRSSKAVVTIIITDANDHSPTFDEMPFRINMTATPPVGVPLLRLSAGDPDLGAHGQLTFNLVRPEQRALFELSATEGLLTVKSSDASLWEPGTIQTLEVSVSDAGRPPRSSTGLIEVSIEGGPATKLTFQQDTYHTELLENPLSGADVAKVRAVRSDGRRQRVIYTFLRGNEQGAFEINSNNGLIRVRDPEVIDYEVTKQFVLTIAGQGLGEDDLNAYATCIVSIKDRNDNVPTFSQNVYAVSLVEGMAKNSIVTKVAAFDLDTEDDLTYEIVSGNVDDAFFMTTAQPGVILTNTVLDREIRDSYELTVSASDNGQPSLTGSARVMISVLDANDSPLQFPAFPPFRVTGGKFICNHKKTREIKYGFFRTSGWLADCHGKSK